MFFRQSGSAFDQNRGEPNRNALRALVEAGEPTGLLAYVGGQPLGWAALAPRPAYARLRRSPLLVGDHDDGDIWSLPCLYVAPAARGRGISHALVDAACLHARKAGARAAEAWPLESAEGRSAMERYVGTRALFAAHGFLETARPRPNRAIMRRTFRPKSPDRAAATGKPVGTGIRR